jgi:hypothetical protein
VVLDLEIKIFLDLQHKAVNAALGSQKDAWLLKKLSQEVTFQKNTAVIQLSVAVEKEVTPMKKLAVSILDQIPMETVTTAMALKVQDTKSWLNM